MRQWKRIIIAVVILAIVTAGFFIIRDIVLTSQPSVNNSLNIVLVDERSDNIESISVLNNGVMLNYVLLEKEVIQDGGTYAKELVWVIEGEEDIDVNQMMINNLIIMSTTLTATATIDEAPEDLIEYGINDQSTVITPITFDGKEYSITLGDMLYDRSGYYAYIGDKAGIYSISLYSANSINISRGDVLNTSIFAGNLNEINVFTLEKDGEIQFTFEADDYYFWMMNDPIYFRANPDVCNDIVTSTVLLETKEYIDLTPDDLGMYGLENPKYAITLTAGEVSTKLLLGLENITDNTFYAMIENRNEVFVIDATTLSFIDNKDLDILWHLVYSPLIVNVSSVDIVVDDTHMFYEIAKNTELGVNDYKFNGESINNFDATGTMFGEFYFSVLIGHFAEIIEPEWEISGEPYASMRITYIDDNFETVKYYDRGDGYCYFVRNDVYKGVLVDKKSVESIKSISDLILDGTIQQDLGVS